MKKKEKKFGIFYLSLLEDCETHAHLSKIGLHSSTETTVQQWQKQVLQNKPYSNHLNTVNWMSSLQMKKSHDLADHSITRHFGPLIGFFTLVFRQPFEI